MRGIPCRPRVVFARHLYGRLSDAGAGGGMGVAAVQLGKALGAKVGLLHALPIRARTCVSASLREPGGPIRPIRSRIVLRTGVTSRLGCARKVRRPLGLTPLCQSGRAFCHAVWGYPPAHAAAPGWL